MEKKHFDDELAGLKHQLVKMSALVETMIAEAMRYFFEGDASVMPTLTQREAEVDAFQKAIDENAMRIVALFQPAAADLRFLLAAVKTNVDLERLADEAVNIANKAERLVRTHTLPSEPDLVRMAALARGMLKDSLHTYVNRDASNAAEIIRRDLQVNELKRQLTGLYLDRAAAQPESIRECLVLMLAVRNIERIGDHAKNIAENTIFAVQGRDIRHPEAPPA